MSEKNLKDFMNKFIANVGDLYDPGHFYFSEVAQRRASNVNLMGALKIINDIIEVIRPQCKFLPVYNRSFITAIRDYYLGNTGHQVEIELPDEIIAYSVFSDEQGTMGGHKEGYSPQSVSPRPAGQMKYGDYVVPVYVEPKDYLVDFIYFSKNNEDLLALVDWFQVTMQTIIKPVLVKAGVLRVEHRVTGDDEVLSEISPAIRLPRSRYYIRVQRIYIDFGPIIDGFIVKYFSLEQT